MDIRLIRFFCLLAWAIASHAGECTGRLDDEQVELITWDASASQMDQKQEKLLVLGIVDSAIAKLQSQFPQLDITSLDNRAHAYSFYTKQDSQTSWENQYDKIVIYLALERDPHREQKLCIMYKALKPGKDGLIVSAPKNFPSIDCLVNQFIETAEWTSFIPNLPLLSLENYRDLLQNIGFHIESERQWVSFLYNTSDITDWVCSRWAIPSHMQSPFIVGFSNFMRKNLPENGIIYSEFRRFRIRKNPAE